MDQERETVGDAVVAAAVFERLLGGSDRENFAVLHLDARHHVLSCEIVATGTLAGALVHPREVFKAAILQNALSIIVAHNHPSGDTRPSAEDQALASRLHQASELIGIKILDFLIVTAGGRFWSEVRHGYP
jgi:DNA repair protein RadC